MTTAQSWDATAEPPELGDEDLHVWSVPLEDPGSQWTGLLSVLAADERERAARFRVEGARRRFVKARAALRTLLGQYTCWPPDKVEFDYHTNGKPRLKNSTSANLQFNMAHSGELALIAITYDCDVGIDLEHLREVHHWQEIAERYFHPREAAEITGLPTGMRLSAFMRCWTGKEAVLKALGAGITRPLDFFVGHTQPEGGTWIDVPAARGQLIPCYVLPLVPAPDYLGAVACLGARRHSHTYRYFPD